jgi:hypothetical protein
LGRKEEPSLPKEPVSDLIQGKAMETLTGRGLQENQDSPQCILEQQNLLVVEDNPEVAQLTCRCFLESGLQERICSYMKSLAEIRQEEMALREQWQKLLRRIEVGGTSG